MTNKYYLFATLLVLLFSCKQVNNRYYLSILKNETGDFRGVNIGSTLAQIKAQENDTFLTNKTDNHLFYDYEINMGNSFTIAYDFTNQNKLKNIKITTYLDDVNEAQVVFENFKKHFNKKYTTKQAIKDGKHTWNNISENHNKNIEFSMINKSESYGVLIINIRKLDL